MPVKIRNHTTKKTARHSKPTWQGRKPGHHRKARGFTSGGEEQQVWAGVTSRMWHLHIPSHPTPRHTCSHTAGSGSRHAQPFPNRPPSPAHMSLGKPFTKTDQSGKIRIHGTEAKTVTAAHRRLSLSPPGQFWLKSLQTLIQISQSCTWRRQAPPDLVTPGLCSALYSQLTQKKDSSH